MAPPSTAPTPDSDSDTTPLADLLDALPIDVAPPTGDDLVDLTKLPTQIGQFELMLYPASNADGQSVIIQARVPPEWLAMIEALRQAPHTNLPDVFPTLSTYFRWSIMAGFARLKEIAHEINQPLGPDLDERLSTLIVLERIGGDVEARARITSETAKRSGTVMNSVGLLISLHEKTEAANLVNKWIDHAQVMESQYFRTVLCKALMMEEQYRASLHILIADGLVVDDWFLSLWEAEGGI